MTNENPSAVDAISPEEIRRILNRAGLTISPQQGQALAELVKQVGGVHEARLALEVVDALRDAA